MTHEQLNFKCQSLPQVVPTLPWMFSQQLQLVPTTQRQLQSVEMHLYWTSFNPHSVHHVCKFVLRSIICQKKNYFARKKITNKNNPN